ncbi:MAG TPA: energy transducer TonB [Bryobacteraceae bacterium]|nr:energy transducer TonB [Bryobacteraceae bacterium]
MNHLSPEQISKVLIGDAALEESQHARECPACQSEVTRMESSLAYFSDSVHQWSEHVMQQDLMLIPKWGFNHGNERTAGISSLLIHAAVVGLILVIGTLKPIQKLVDRTITTLIAPDLKPYLPEKPMARGGGGGGDRSQLDASKGKLPKIAPRQFTPPRVDPAENPKLPMTPTIVAESVPNISAPNYGDPLSHLGVPSNGTGWSGGIGSGIGGGVGVGRGVGYGLGANGGFGGGAYRIGGGVSPPSVLSKVEPEYSEDARKAKWQGTVTLQIVVDEHGNPQQMQVTRALGMGLDQKAMEAVSKWRFRPGMKDGKPVPVIATIEVNFRLL